MNIFLLILLLCMLGFVLGGSSSSWSTQSKKISWKKIPFIDIVISAEYVTRGFISKRRKRGFGNYRIRHDAVVVSTLHSGSWLIEKGKSYASRSYSDHDTYPWSDSNTVAIPWENRDSYKTLKTIKPHILCGLIVSNVMGAALPYTRYHPINANCQHAAKSMWEWTTFVTSSCHHTFLELSSLVLSHLRRERDVSDYGRIINVNETMLTIDNQNVTGMVDHSWSFTKVPLLLKDTVYKNSK